MNILVEYWEGSLPLKSIGGDVSIWDTLPREGVVRVRLSHPGFERPNKTYTTILVGSDYYYLYKVVDHIVFGCWTDPSQPWAAEGYAGRQYLLSPNNQMNSIRLSDPPLDLFPLWVKEGVMLPEDQATEIGLIGNETPSSDRRTCCG